MQTYSLKTKRLGLRLLEAGDMVFLADLESDPVVKKYFPDGPRGDEKTAAMIKKFMANYEKIGLPCFLLFDLETHEFIGRAGFGITESGETEVGYVLHQKFWGKGFAAEAVAALLDYARKNIAVQYIIAYATADNIASIRVMEKCGMTYYKTAVAKGEQCQFYRIKNS